MILTIAVSTATNWPEDMAGMAIDFIPHDFSVIGEDGVTENDVAGNAYSCLDDGDIVPDVGPGENAAGKLALDVNSETGVLVYRPLYVMLEGGWEWTF